MTQAQMYRHTRVLAAPARRATREDAQMLARLADAAIATAAEFGVPCTRREALQRSRENLAYVHQLSLVREMELARNLGVGGVKETTR